MSPLAAAEFNVFLESICRCIEQQVSHMGVNVGYSIDGHLTECKRPASTMTCRIILYANDIVILTDSETKVQEMLDILQSTLLIGE